MAERQDGRKRANLKGDKPAPEILSPENIAKYEGIIRQTGDDDCILWPLSVDKRSGSGFFVPIGRSAMCARRFALSAFCRGAEKNEVPLSTCGNKACVNLRHLKWQTRSRMTKELTVSGKLPLPPTVGEENSAAILTEEDVFFIRRSSMSLERLASKFGVAKSTISAARTNQTWRHLL